jgi:lipopolysaccharide/colanic/teichoic acid biosynthesis glycosyltransferase
MKMAEEGRSHNLALQLTELVWSGNGSRARDNGSDQRSGSRECKSPFPDVPRWKRVLDVTCVLVTLPFWLPVIILVMAWIAIASRGPVFFRQERVGYRRRPFMIFKFRTMHVNAETQTHAEYFFRLMKEDCPMTKLDAAGDPRLIAGGRFLRASALDELPQIFNVLRGEMSLVGPRPCLPHEFERYDAWQQERVNAPPGLTGFWQVSGKNKTTFSEMIAMDIFYARNMSPGLDLRIILKTIPALIEQTLEGRRARQIESRQRSVRTIAVPKNTNGAVEKI